MFLWVSVDLNNPSFFTRNFYRPLSEGYVFTGICLFNLGGGGGGGSRSWQGPPSWGVVDQPPSRTRHLSPQPPGPGTYPLGPGNLSIGPGTYPPFRTRHLPPKIRHLSPLTPQTRHLTPPPPPPQEGPLTYPSLPTKVNAWWYASYWNAFLL